MNVLSLFDGMSCGMIAFQKAGIEVDEYTAYEIDKYAIKTATHNFPQIKEMGDVFKADFTQFKDIDYIIGGSPCVPAGTKIKVKNGYKNIEDISIGDLVLTHQNRYMPVVETYQRKTDHLYSIKFNGSETLKLTGNHPMYVYRNNKFEWIPAGNLKVGDYICCNINQDNLSFEFPKNYLWLLGRMIADGYVDETKPRVVVAVGQKKRAEFEKHLTGMEYYICHSNRPAAEYCIKNKDFVDLCKMIEKGAINKYIPDDIVRLNKESLKIFFNGYFSGDGHRRVNKPEVYMWSTISEKLYLSMVNVSVKLFDKYPTVTRKKEKPKKMIGDRYFNQHDSFNSQVSLGGRKCSQIVIEDKLLIPIKDIKKEDIDCEVYNIQVEEDESYTINNIIVHNCTYWSIAQSTDKRETTASGIGWELFSQYVRALREVKPKFFIYENNKSMSKEIRKSISETFGFEPICINSALLSAQNRQRLYWVGKRNEDNTYSKVDIKQPEDKGILLKDILDTGISIINKHDCLDANYFKGGNYNNLNKQSGRRLCVAESVIFNNPHGYNKGSFTTDKVGTLTSSYFQENHKVIEPVCMRYERSDKAKELRKNYESGKIKHGFHEFSELQPRNDGKSNTLTTVLKDNPICEPVAFSMVGDLDDRKVGTKEKAYCLAANPSSDMSARVMEPVACRCRGRKDEDGNGYAKYECRDDNKYNTVDTNANSAMVAEPVGIGERTRDRNNIPKGQRYEAREDNKSNCLTTVQKDCQVAEPIRVGTYPTSDGRLLDSQGMRVYSTEGKSVTQSAQGGGMGAKTGLYAIPIEWEVKELSENYYHGDKDTNVFGMIECNNSSNNNGQPAQGTRVYNIDTKSVCLDTDSRKYIIVRVPTKAISCADGKEYPVYEVKNGNIAIKNKTYPIKLQDGYYIIRKLTVSECKRLQTVPEWYEFPVSNSQSYKMLGNGWTCDVITHLIKATQKEK